MCFAGLSQADGGLGGCEKAFKQARLGRPRREEHLAGLRPGGVSQQQRDGDDVDHR